jgi:protein-disulfide isomerase
MVMGGRIWLIVCAAFLVAGLARVAGAEEFNPAQRTEMESIIKDYLLSHPELLTEMSKTLEDKQKLAEDEQRKSALTSSADQIFRDKADFVAGNTKGNVTMVEFFDYNCGWCKKGFPEVMSLLQADKNLRFVLKEFPIFGDDSEYAAKAALASERQGKYWKLHLAMFSHAGKITKSTVDEIAAAQGLDMAKLKKDMADPAIEATLSRTRELAQSLAINGTPAFIIDDKLVPGYLPQADLAAAIDEVRAKGCTLC